MNWALDAEPAPALLVLPPDAASLDEADAACELWEHYSGKKLDPTQRLTVQVMMAESSDGLWAASTTGREMPRQNGKGDEVEVVELWGLVHRSEAILHTVHDAVLLATQTQQRMLGVLEGHPDLRRRVRRKWQGTGQQMIEMNNGGIIWYRTRTGGGGRGVDDIDRLVIDEAQHANDDHLAALTPTLLANANPQLNVLGTAGLDGKSSWWWTVRRRALSDDPGRRFGYVGHTAETVTLDADGRVIQESVDVTDRSLWDAANPALHTGRGRGPEFLAEQLQRLGESSFAREHLCVWDPPPLSAGGDGPIPPATWHALAQISAIESHHQWALAVSTDRKWAALGVAGRRADGLAHVEWMDHRAGTSWVVGRCVEAWEARHIPIRIRTGGAASSFVDQLRERGVEVVEVSGADYARATGALIDAANNRQLRHLGQPSLDKALGLAELRTTSSGSSTWHEPSGTDITTLESVTVALGGVPDTDPVFDGDWFVDLDDFEEV